jgi:hypothetical protein
MKIQLRPLVAAALYPTKAHNLPAVCERYGLERGDKDEAFASGWESSAVSSSDWISVSFVTCIMRLV